MAICYDHLGNKFNSKKEMCKYYGVCHSTFKQRIEAGWALKDVLTKPIRNISRCKDHLGNEFNSQAEMCRHHGVEVKNYHERIKLGWTVEDALTKKGQQTECYDHLGNKFESKKEMCKYYGKSPVLVINRLNRGWTLEDALTKDIKETPNNIHHDHLGNEYKSMTDMCMHYGISGSTFYHRLKSGWSIEDALTTPIRECEKKCTDHLGNRYDSIVEMCEYYGIDSQTFSSRVSYGWDIKDALTIPVNNEKKCKDHLGNKFNSHKEMCKYYGVGYAVYITRVKNYDWSLSDALEISGKGLEANIKNKIVLNTNLCNIKFAYTGRNGKIYYTCIDKDTGEELLLNADEILMYKQSDYRTAVEQLIKRRKEKLSC